MHKRTVAPIVALICGVLYLCLLFVVHDAPSIVRVIDDVASDIIHPLQTFSWIQFFLVITVFGGWTGVITLTLGALYFLRKSKRQARGLLLVVAATGIAASASKIFVARLRPDALVWLTAPHSYSFPSGHAASAAALYGFLALIAWRRAQTTTQRIFSILLPVLLILLVGLSRIVLHVHYLSDVVGGYLLAGFWIAVVAAVTFRDKHH